MSQQMLLIQNPSDGQTLCLEYQTPSHTITKPCLYHVFTILHYY